MNNKDKIMDIAMNLNRIGNWAADDYKLKQKRIIIFLAQTSDYLKSLKQSIFSDNFKKTFNHFINDYRQLEKEGKQGPKDELAWAEKMMTWGNILTHRAKLLK
ncbi:MAG: hypothetical protein M1268_00780 [Patescibacteria group bacterium]|nr:hypothetical protein [Actinomycetota bacterium]MCL5438507.1 hypothetical protein [Patescibacteria group bacterium]